MAVMKALHIPQTVAARRAPRAVRPLPNGVAPCREVKSDQFNLEHSELSRAGAI